METASARPRNRTDETSTSAASLTDRVRSLKLPDHVTHPRSSSKIPWLIVGVLGCATVFLGYREYEHAINPAVAAAEGSEPTSAETPSDSASVAAAKPTEAPPAEGSLALESKGYLVPAHQILVSPKVSGMVVRLHIVEGQKVEKGEKLAELEKVDYEADLRRAQAVLALATARRDLMVAGSRVEERDQADAEVAEAERQLEQQRVDHLRNEALRAKEKSLVADQIYEEQKALYEASLFRVQRLKLRRQQIFNGNRKEEIAAAEAEVLQAQADLDKMKWKVQNCTIVAPISGTVLKKNAEEGNIVNTIAPNGSFSLCDLADLSDLEVDLSIQERDVSKVHTGQKCQVRTDAYPDRLYEGIVDRLLPIADRAKGAIPVRVKVKVPKIEEGVYLKPDMSAIVTFYNGKPAPTPQPSPESAATK